MLHVVAVGAALLSSPFDHRKKMDFGEVIKVSLKSMSDIQKSAPEPAPLVIPQPKLSDDAVEIPLEDPRTVKTKKEIEKPEEKPKPEAEKKEEPPSTTQSTEPQEKEIDTKSTDVGQMFAGATVHSTNFDYPYWYDQAFSKIKSNMRNTVSSDSPLICKVYFEVIQSGRLISVKVAESSGIPQFDDACVSAIERSAPFPPLPRNFREEILGISLPFSTASLQN
jgi:protein TonB